MDFARVAEQLAVARARVNELRSQAATEPGQPAGALGPALAQLSDSLAELETAEQLLAERADEQRRAHDAIEAERQRYRALFEFAPDGYLVTDRHGRIQEANWAAGILLNEPEENLVDRLLPGIVAPGNESAFAAEMARLDGVDGVREWETRLQPRDYAPFDASVVVVPDRDHTGHVVGLRWLLRDITARRQAAEQVQRLMAELEQRVHERTAQLEAANHDLHAANEVLQALVLSSPLAIVVLDRDGLVGTWSPAAEKLFGWQAHEVIGREPPYLPDRKAAAQHLRQPRQFEQDAEIRLFQRDGAPLDVSAWSAPLHDAHGHSFGSMQVYIDIGERKRAEEKIRALNAGLEQRVAERTAELEAKNRELETFTYSVSHDLKAPLRGIDGYSRLLQQEQAGRLDPEGRSNLARISGAVSQMYQLIDDLLAYSRLEQKAVTRGPVNLTNLVNAIVDERAVELQQRGIRVSVDIACGQATADVDGLTQAIRNLLDNALKFTYSIPDPHIEIRGAEFGDHCTLSIRDNGIGFDMQHHDRIFGIFQRLHRSEEFPGTGIGLAIVQKAMRRMNGNVWAESAAGQGACFHLEIPK